MGGCMSVGHNNVVLVFQGAFCQSNRAELDGIHRFARERGWRIQTVEYGSAAESRLNLQGSGAVFQVRPLISFWNPIGCIVECSGLAPKFVIEHFGKTPTVFLDRHPSTLPKSAACVFSDADSIATCAAKELLSLGFSDYAYVPWIQETVWSRERGERFKQLVRMNGKRFHCFKAAFQVGSELAYRKKLKKWVTQLPKPCGIFVANDSLGEQVLTACLDTGISVPDEIAVLGVDDELQICENTKPTLSSIQVDNENAGYMAAEMLSERMARRAAQSRSFGARKVNRRSSTQRILKGGNRLLKAIEYIRLNACSGISVMDVVSQMGCSRRMADRYFKESLGHTVLDQIHAVRLVKVKDMLSAPSSDLSELAAIAGYSSNDDLRRVFKKRIGCTMRDYQKSLIDSSKCVQK